MTSPEQLTDNSNLPTPRSPGRFAMLPQLAGHWFIPLGVLARLPMAMSMVGVLTLITATSHSYASGGFASGAVGIGSAIGAPMVGFLADRRGQRPVLLVAAGVNTVVLGLLLWLVAAVPASADSFMGMVLALSFALGLSTPQVGPLARVRWVAMSERLTQPSRGQLVGTALSFEGTADEATFVLGPALVGILASFITPWLPLALAALLTLVFVSLFAIHPTVKTITVTHRSAGTRKLQGTRRSRGEKPSGTWLRVAVPVLAMVCMGTFFGSSQTALSAFAGTFGASSLAGLLYAVMGLTSAAAALSVAYWPAKFTQSRRWILCAALMTAGSLLLQVPHSLVAMACMLLLLGLPVGPLMVTVFTIGSIVSPPRFLGTVMTALASGIVAGTALGSSIAGQLAQQDGAGPALLVPTAAAAALLALGVAAAVVTRRNGTQQRDGDVP